MTSIVDNIVDLHAARKEREPHSTGEARCLSCNHEWIAVAPTGTVWLECPECSIEKGRFVAHHERSGDHWECDCGCDLFYITPDGMYCPNCGDWQHGF